MDITVLPYVEMLRRRLMELKNDREDLKKKSSMKSPIMSKIDSKASASRWCKVTMIVPNKSLWEVSWIYATTIS